MLGASRTLFTLVVVCLGDDHFIYDVWFLKMYEVFLVKVFISC
jgi:hypothetical protein